MIDFQENLKKLPYDFYDWPSYSVQKKRYDKCFLFVQDLRAFFAHEYKYFSFLTKLSSYKEMNIIFALKAYRVEQVFSLQKLIVQQGYTLKIIQSKRRTPRYSYSFYLGPHRDWLSGLIHQKRFQKIVLVIKKNCLQEELRYWQSQGIIISTNLNIKQADLILIEPDQIFDLESAHLKTIFFSPAVKDLSWQLNGHEYHIFLHVHGLKLLQAFPLAFMTALPKFYRYRLLY